MAESGGRLSARLGCAVLAAGGSRRLGRPKQLLTVGGVPLVRRAALAALSAWHVECAVVLGANGARVRALLRDLPLTWLENPDWPSGMASSVRLAARWAKSAALDGLLLTVCDQPRLDAAQLERLMLEFRAGETVVASFYAGVPGVPALFPRALFEELCELQGDVGARSLLRRAVSRVLVPWPDGAVDIDTPEQLANERAPR